MALSKVLDAIVGELETVIKLDVVMDSRCIVDNSVLAPEVLHQSLVASFLHLPAHRVNDSKDGIFLLWDHKGIDTFRPKHKRINVVTLFIHLHILCFVAWPELRGDPS